MAHVAWQNQDAPLLYHPLPGFGWQHLVCMTGGPSEANMLMSLTCPPVSPLPPPSRHSEIGRRARQVMVTALELLQVLVVDQPLLPEMLEEMEIGSAGPKSDAEQVVICDMLHATVPGRPPILISVFEVTQRARDRLWRLLTAKMREAVCPPLFLVVGDVRAAEEPEGALKGGPAYVAGLHLQHAVDLLKQVHTRQAARQPRTYRCLGRRGFREVVERRRGLRGRAGLMDAGRGHAGGV